MMPSVLNVPEIPFPVKWSQRLNGEDTREIQLRENLESGIVEMTVFRGDSPVFRGLPIYVDNYAGVNLPDSDYAYYGHSPGDGQPDVTQENLFDDVVEIRAVKK